jgi:radical SAM protein with 4Fe4S-binding SPASM domain
LRYGGREGTAIARPVVVWNCTGRCNLRCAHCYADANSAEACDQMSTAEGLTLINDLADFGVPVILFSGGEPLMRDDLFQFARLAAKRGIRIALSTNGTLIDANMAGVIRDIGFAEVGISLDGIESTNDRFRGKKGAYSEALDGIRHCLAEGVRVSLRLTITGANHLELPQVFDLVEREGISRVCIYHLAYAGRGEGLQNNDVTHEETRRAVDYICERTVDMHSRGLHKEVLTVGNHADGVYAFLKTRALDPDRCEKILGLLKMNGGNNSGVRIGAIDERGDVHPDQFWRNHTVGNVRRDKFEDIWSNEDEPLLAKLRKRKGFLLGRCARCKYVELCNGNLRSRAEAVYGNIWAEDPACYLTDEEIGA